VIANLLGAPANVADTLLDDATFDWARWRIHQSRMSRMTNGVLELLDCTLHLHKVHSAHTT
jgi:hypothetical protein